MSADFSDSASGLGAACGSGPPIGSGAADESAASGTSGTADAEGLTGAPGRADLTRRKALKVLATTAASTAALANATCGPAESAPESAHEVLSGFDPVPPSNPLAAGTLADPDLLAPVVPWDLVLTAEEMEMAAVLADLIVPADDRSPSASAVGVPAYVNEFLSAPGHEELLTLVRGGFAWLNRAARERFGTAAFATLPDDRKRQICDEICHEPAAPSHLKTQARFFDMFRDAVSTGFWTTDAGMQDLGYVGNVPLPAFEGPPQEVLDQLGLSGEDLE